MDQPACLGPDHQLFEQGPVMIDEYLFDYVAMLHPELAPDHEFVFFSAGPAVVSDLSI